MNTMITDAAVEAGASAISARHLSNTGVPFPIKACRDDARVALEAALPHLAAVKQSLTVAPSVDAWAVADIVRSDLDRQSCPDAYMRIAVESVVKHLTATLEAGNPVSVSERAARAERHLVALEEFAARHGKSDDAEGLTEFFGRMHYACGRDDAIAARQPVGEAVAWAALNENGQIAYFDGKPMIMPGPVGNAIHTSPLYAAPPAQQPAQRTDVEHLKPIHASMTEALARVAEAGSSVDAECERDLVPRESYMPHLRRAVDQLHKLGALINGMGNSNG